MRDFVVHCLALWLCRCYFAQHDKTMLIGADPSHVGDRCIRVTIHHCFFDGTRQRHPRVRFAQVHLYNNYTRNWGIYAVCASVESQVLTHLISSKYILVQVFPKIYPLFPTVTVIVSCCLHFESDILSVQHIRSRTEKVGV